MVIFWKGRQTNTGKAIEKEKKTYVETAKIKYSN